MAYLSPQIEILAKKNQQHSLLKKENSCGIFQDYGFEQQTVPSENKNSKMEL